MSGLTDNTPQMHATNSNSQQALPEPLPVLNFDQARHLAYHGWLPLTLPNHFIEKLHALSSASESFFDQGDEDKVKLYPPSRGTECGFYKVPEEKEYVTLRRRSVNESRLEQCAQALWSEAAHLLHRILCDLSRAGYYDVHGWDHLVEGSLSLPEVESNLDTIISLMRLFRYYPQAGVAEEHVDVGLLTLCIGEGSGLQLLDWDTKEYVDATQPTVLIGDMTRALLRNQVRAGSHRVVSNPVGRHSTVFALRPNLSGSTDLTVFGGRGTVDTKEFFYRIKGRKYNINATRGIRKGQQQKLQAESEKAKPSTGLSDK